MWYSPPPGCHSRAFCRSQPARGDPGSADGAAGRAPVIAEDLLEGVFVDPLSVVCHGRWLYHTLPPGSTCLPSLPCAPPWSLQREQGQQKKGNSYTLKIRAVLRCIASSSLGMRGHPREPHPVPTAPA